ncbi:peptide ABC transporter substrate-binding protein [Maricaulaceae bacterium EIL42A08]|nr:peptide ABC transporter substrate-binding protein [Maricaulaceae bacterium EIL42A08]
MKRSLFILAAALGVSACSEGGGTGQIERLESGVIYRNEGPEISTVDPHQADGTWAEPINGDMFVGLLRRGPDGIPGPALATDWTVSEDALTWTFSMRDAVWSDGRAITADDVVFSLRRAVDPATAAAYVEVYGPIENARAILSGQADPDTLGVTALDARTVEIRLSEPMAFLPELLADSRGAVLPQHVIEAHGDAWVQPANIVVNGAYTLVERILDRQTVLRRNPLYYDNANVCFDEVFYFPISAPETAARQARAGELDIAAAVPANIVALIETEMPGHINHATPPATFYFQANTERAPFDDVRVREALAISIDREFAFTEVVTSGMRVANSLVPEGLAAPYEAARVTWADEPLEARRERAVALLREAGFGPDNPLRFEYSYPSGGVANRVVPVFQNDWNSLADWVQVEIFGAEAAVHYQNLGAGEFEAALGGWSATVRDVSYMLDVIREGSVGNFPRWVNEDANGLLAQADRERDPAVRADLLRQAEQIALDDFAIAPFYHPERAWMVHPRIEGWVGGAVEYMPTTHLCLSDGEG